MRSVTSMRGRPSSASGTTLEAGDALGLLVPRRADAEQGQGLGDVVAAGAHGGGAPQHEADRGRGGCRSRRGGARRARSASAEPTSHDSRRRDRLRVDRVEVAARRQHVGGATAGRAARPGRARGGRRARRAGWRSRRPHARRSGTRRRRTHRSVGSAVDVGSQPVAGEAPRPGRGTRASTRSMSTRPAVSRSMPSSAATVARSDGTAPWGRRVMASTSSTSAASAGARAEHVEPAADLGVLEGAQVAVDVAGPRRRTTPRRAGRRRGRGRGGSRRRRARPTPGPGSPAAWPGPSPRLWAWPSSSCSSWARSS